jgi:hypothetical protein
VFPTNVILDSLATLLATDASKLADPANAVHVHLAQNAFTPAAGLLIGSLVEATFDGSTAKNAGLGAQQEFLDGLSGRRTVQLNEPAGGWHWQVTGVTALPQTIYGFYVTDLADAVVYGSARLDAPVLLNGIGQAIDVANVRFTFQTPVLT